MINTMNQKRKTLSPGDYNGNKKKKKIDCDQTGTQVKQRSSHGVKDTTTSSIKNKTVSSKHEKTVSENKKDSKLSNDCEIKHNSKKSKASTKDKRKYRFKKAKNKKGKIQSKTADKNINEESTETKKEIDLMPLPHSEKDFSSNWKKFSANIAKDKSKTTKKPTRRRQEIEEKDDQEQNRDSEIWFDDVDDILINSLKRSKKYETTKKAAEEENAAVATTDNPLIKSQSFEGLTKVIAIDCEMVGVGSGGKDSILARVSIVNQYGHCVYDKYVKPTERVTDYRTHVSGIRPEDIVEGEDFSIVQKDVSDIFKGRTLVGHAIQNDLKVLFLDHPKKKIRDTSRYKPFRKLFSGGLPSLKKLTAKVLSVDVQEGEHNSIQDAQAAMRLYTTFRTKWEKDLKTKKTKK